MVGQAVSKSSSSCDLRRATVVLNRNAVAVRGSGRPAMDAADAVRRNDRRDSRTSSFIDGARLRRVFPDHGCIGHHERHAGDIAHPGICNSNGRMVVRRDIADATLLGHSGHRAFPAGDRWTNVSKPGRSLRDRCYCAAKDRSRANRSTTSAVVSHAHIRRQPVSPRNV